MPVDQPASGKKKKRTVNRSVVSVSPRDGCGIERGVKVSVEELAVRNQLERSGGGSGVMSTQGRNAQINTSSLEPAGHGLRVTRQRRDNKKREGLSDGGGGGKRVGFKPHLLEERGNEKGSP